MAARDNFHSQLVAWMKIILPLAALGLLSTLFLLSTNVDPTKSIPATQIDLAQRAQDQGATNAAFAGVTEGGQELMIAAATARPSPGDTRLINAEDVTAEILLNSGARIDVVSDSGLLHQSDLKASLIGGVRITTSTRYDITTDRLDTRLDVLEATTPGKVSGTGPPGDLQAGRMRLTSDKTTGHAHLVFTDGVKLVYSPQPAKDQDQ